jgi:plasmid maintenance system antidote protein VapI
MAAQLFPPATVAGILGVDKSAVSHWLNGKRAISPPMRVRVAVAPYSRTLA